MGLALLHHAGMLLHEYLLLFSMHDISLVLAFFVDGHMVIVRGYWNIPVYPQV